MDMAAVDQVRLNFNPQGLFVINGAIGLMMFGVAPLMTNNPRGLKFNRT